MGAGVGQRLPGGTCSGTSGPWPGTEGTGDLAWCEAAKAGDWVLSSELGPARLSSRSGRRDPEGSVGLLIITRLSGTGLAAHAFWEAAPPSGGSARTRLGWTGSSRTARLRIGRRVGSGDCCGGGAVTFLRPLRRPLIGPAQDEWPHPAAGQGAAEAYLRTRSPGRGLARDGARRSRCCLGRRENGV